jgi:hypothetical protein
MRSGTLSGLRQPIFPDTYSSCTGMAPDTFLLREILTIAALLLSGACAGSSRAVELCNGETPYTSADCGTTLKMHCRSHLSQQACGEQRPILLGQNTYLCGWAKVVTFEENSECKVQSVGGRCEAGSPGLAPCGSPCEPVPGGRHGLYDSLIAIASERELIQMPCAPDGSALAGPIGEWTALTNQSADSRYVQSCGADSPAPPSICSCTAPACAAN